MPSIAPTYIANAVTLIAFVLTYFNIQVAPASLQITVTTILLIATPLFTMFRQWKTGRSTPLGTRPKA